MVYLHYQKCLWLVKVLVVCLLTFSSTVGQGMANELQRMAGAIPRHPHHPEVDVSIIVILKILFCAIEGAQGDQAFSYMDISTINIKYSVAYHIDKI